MPLPADAITPKEAAALLRVSKTTIYAWIDSGELPSVTVGRRYRISRRDVLAMVQDVQVEEPIRTTGEDEQAAKAALERMKKRKDAG